MGEAGKLVIGFMGVVIGLAAGFGVVVLIMQRTGGALFETPALGLLVVAGLVGGGAPLRAGQRPSGGASAPPQIVSSPFSDCTT